MSVLLRKRIIVASKKTLLLEMAEKSLSDSLMWFVFAFIEEKFEFGPPDFRAVTEEGGPLPMTEVVVIMSYDVRATQNVTAWTQSKRFSHLRRSESFRSRTNFNSIFHELKKIVIGLDCLEMEKWSKNMVNLNHIGTIPQNELQQNQ